MHDYFGFEGIASYAAGYAEWGIIGKPIDSPGMWMDDVETVEVIAGPDPPLAIPHDMPGGLRTDAIFIVVNIGVAHCER